MGDFRYVLSRVLITLLPTAFAHGQVVGYPFVEHFDSIAVPSLPAGWATTTNRLSTGDFFSTTSSPRSVPNALQSTNSVIPQSLLSPAFSFLNRVPNTLEFHASRSSTHLSGFLVEATVDSGMTFFPLSDTIMHPGTTSYAPTNLPLPPALSQQPFVRFRWRVLGGSGGTTGTFRIDDMTVTVFTSYDLAVTGLSLSPSNPTALDPVMLRCVIRNLGMFAASGYTVRFYLDGDNNGLPDDSEEFAAESGPAIAPNDSTEISTMHEPLTPGNHTFLAVISYKGDELLTNNSGQLTAGIAALPASFVVNEIFYEPLSGQNEWIELYHRGTGIVEFERWSFSDRPTASGRNTFLMSSSTRIRPGEYVVVAADSSILILFPDLRPFLGTHLIILNKPGGFSLGNDGDDIVLSDITGSVIDSLQYSPAWHNPDVTDLRGRSLERINPDIDSNDRRNWSTSAHAAGGTPGLRNSLFTASLPSGAALSVNPNPFSPDGDGFEDVCIVKYRLPFSSSIIRIRIFDLRGRLIRLLADGEPAGPEGEVIWDGFDNEKRRARIGPHVVLLEAIGTQGSTSSKAVVVVATKL